MSLEQNKMLVRQLLEAQERGDVAQMHELLAPDFFWYVAGMPQRLTREDYIQGVQMGLQAFSNLKLSVEDMIAEGEKVALSITVRGKHAGIFQGMEPTGKQVEYTSVAICRIVDAKIVEEWLLNDQWKLFEQLGGLSPQS